MFKNCFYELRKTRSGLVAINAGISVLLLLSASTDSSMRQVQRISSLLSLNFLEYNILQSIRFKMEALISAYTRVVSIKSQIQYGQTLENHYLPTYYVGVDLYVEVRHDLLISPSMSHERCVA